MPEDEDEDAPAPDGPLGVPVAGLPQERVHDRTAAGHPGPGAGAAEVQGKSPGGHGPAAEPAVSVARPERPGLLTDPEPSGPASVTKRSGTFAPGPARQGG